MQLLLATAVAALVQLRHMRSSNQIAAITEFRETLESEQFTRAREFLAENVANLISDAEGRCRLGSTPLPSELAPVRTLGNFFEVMGAFVKFGIIDRRLACDLWDGLVLSAWKDLEPVVMIRRESHNRGLWTNFEFLAVLCDEWISKHPVGNYPRGLPRMTITPRSMAAAAAYVQDQNATVQHIADTSSL